MNEARVAPPQHVAGVARPPVAPVATPPVAELPSGKDRGKASPWRASSPAASGGIPGGAGGKRPDQPWQDVTRAFGRFLPLRNFAATPLQR